MNLIYYELIDIHLQWQKNNYLWDGYICLHGCWFLISEDTSLTVITRQISAPVFLCGCNSDSFFSLRTSLGKYWLHIVGSKQCENIDKITLWHALCVIGFLWKQTLFTSLRRVPPRWLITQKTSLWICIDTNNALWTTNLDFNYNARLNYVYNI